MTIHTDEFERLCRARGGARLSIYMPTHRRGAEVEQGPIRLKNLLAESERRLEERGIDAEALGDAWEALRALERDIEFWRHQGEGLALFASSEGLRHYRLGAPVEELAYAGERWCARPLLSEAVDGGAFHVLAFSQNLVRLLECTDEGAGEMDLGDIPENLASAVGADRARDTLQFHTGAAPVGSAPGGPRAAVFHGHGGAPDEKKQEIEQFLTRIDAGLRTALRGRTDPLVLAAVDREASWFRRITGHPRVLERGLSGNPDHLSADALREAAAPIAREALDARARARREALRAFAHSERVVCGLEEVLPAAREGRVDLIVVRPERAVWGRLSGNTVRVHERREAGDDDLLDLAISEAVGAGAEALAAGEGDVPGDARVAARLRY